MRAVRLDYVYLGMVVTAVLLTPQHSQSLPEHIPILIVRERSLERWRQTTSLGECLNGLFGLLKVRRLHCRYLRITGC